MPINNGYQNNVQLRIIYVKINSYKIKFYEWGNLGKLHARVDQQRADRFSLYDDKVSFHTELYVLLIVHCHHFCITQRATSHSRNLTSPVLS